MDKLLFCITSFGPVSFMESMKFFVSGGSSPAWSYLHGFAGIVMCSSNSVTPAQCPLLQRISQLQSHKGVPFLEIK